MTKLKPIGYAAAWLFVLYAWPLLAQTSTGKPPSSTPQGSATGSTTGRGSTIPGAQQRKGRPCWEKAGVPESVNQQRREIEEKTHAQVEQVCHDSSLTPQQKKEKIRQLRDEARSRTEALLTPEQRKAVGGCREEHGEHRSSTGGGHMHGGGGGGGAGPCGDMPSSTGGRTSQGSTTDR